MADLHIHSTLSPCGSLEMSPIKIVERAKESGLNLISITDHNSIQNLQYLKNIALNYNIDILYGMEVQTEEEVHILTYFDHYDSIERVWKYVYERLPNVKNRPEIFGDQVIVDENENIISFEEKLLLNSSKVTLEKLCHLVEEEEGLAIPAHIDSSTYSIIGQLGFIPEALFFPFLEITYTCNEAEITKQFPFLENYILVSFSDAHYLSDIGRSFTEFWVETPSINAIKCTAKDRNLIKIKRQGGSKWLT